LATTYVAISAETGWPQRPRACRDLGFARLPVERLISLIRPENLQSRRVAEKNGMTVWKETMRQNLPCLVYAISRDQAVVQ